MRVVSVPGRRIVDPITRRVVDEVGIEVNQHDPFWTRLINDGDVAVQDVQLTAASPSETDATTAKDDASPSSTKSSSKTSATSE